MKRCQGGLFHERGKKEYNTKMMQRRVHRNYVWGILTALLVVGAGVFLFGASASAQGGIIPQCNWAGGETYGLGAFTKLALNVLEFIWGILGSLALVMFVWGGFLWLTARGEENQIKQGWDTLVNAVIGLLIVLGSWLIINTIILALTTPGQWQLARVFNQDWTELVEGDICVNVAARVAGTGIGKGATGSGTGTSGPGGVCCYASSGLTKRAETVSQDVCEQRVSTRAADEALFCVGATDERACGDPEDDGGRIVWKNTTCDRGKVTITRVALDEKCGRTSDTVRVCEAQYGCDANNPQNETRCTDPNEQILCCVYADAVLRGASDQKKIVRVQAPKLARKSCIEFAKASVPTSIVDPSNSQEWDTTFNEALACSAVPSGQDCLVAGTGQQISQIVGGLGLTAAGTIIEIVSIPLITAGGIGIPGVGLGAALITGGAAMTATGGTNLIFNGAIPRDSCRVIK